MPGMTKYDLIQYMSGANEEGFSKCSIGVKFQRQNAEGELIPVEDEFVSQKPIIQISNPANGFILVDLIFDSVDDLDLQIIFAKVQRYFAAASSINEDDEDYPLFSLAIIPEELQGKYWALGLNPIFYALTPDDIYGEPKIIRMTFCYQEDPDAPPPNFIFFNSPEEALENILEDETEDYE